MSTRRAARATAFAVLALAVSLAVVILATGGVRWRWGPIRISAHETRNPLTAAIMAAAVAWALSSREERRRMLPVTLAWIRAEEGPFRPFRESPERLAKLIAGAACLAIVLLGLLKGTFVAGGADSYGYVSQADLWARGQLVVQQPFARDMTWPNAAATLVPLGYTLRDPASPGADLVAVYSAGLPMLMALARLVVGAKGVFLVVPILGGLAVWATFVMGRRTAGHTAGAAAAVMLATSPSFLFEVTSPTSDVPVTAWWACALALLLADSQAAALAAGVAVSAAVLTRPNLALIVVVPGLFLLVQAMRDADAGARRKLLLFAAGLLPGYVGVASLNAYLYGSPFASGYGRVNDLYGWANLHANAIRYPRWLLDTQTPVVLLSVAAPWLCWRAQRGATCRLAWTTATMWWLFASAVLCSYLFYQPFDSWGYLRFLLPAYPPILVLTVVSLALLLAPLRTAGRWVPEIVAGAIVALVAWHGVSYAVEGRLMTFWRDEQRYVTAGEWVSAHLPERAVLLSGQHSGSARLYSGRLTVRYDLIPPSALDIVVKELRRLGYSPYLLLDDSEEADFRKRFQGHSALGPLDWWPVAMIQGRLVKIYDVPERPAIEPSR